MILADTSVWVDYFRTGSVDLSSRLLSWEILGHPLVIGELAMGNLSNRRTLLSNLEALPQAVTATDGEVRRLVESYELFGKGIGFVDAHLLASARLTPNARLWTLDKRLAAIALKFGVGL